MFTEEPPKLTRTKTTVSTDYQFSACYLTQLGTSFSYDYEYNGPSCRLVLTPLTERAFLSLTQAIKNFHCGTLVGPAGVGKSETIKELAKVMVILTAYEIYPAHIKANLLVCEYQHHVQLVLTLDLFPDVWEELVHS